MTYWNAILTDGYTLTSGASPIEDWHKALLDRGGTSSDWIPSAIPSARGELLFEATDGSASALTQVTLWTAFECPAPRKVKVALQPDANSGVYQLRVNGRVYEYDDTGHVIDLALRGGANEICLTFQMDPLQVRFFGLLWSPSGSGGKWIPPKEIR